MRWRLARAAGADLGDLAVQTVLGRVLSSGSLASMCVALDISRLHSGLADRPRSAVTPLETGLGPDGDRGMLISRSHMT